MKKTLQDQYLLIKEGKGHVGVFLAEAKREFPHIVRNAATFDEAVASLKTKNIISENVMVVMPAIMDRPKKESYETAFEAFLAEAKKKNEDEKVKAEEKKVSKPVEEDLAHNYDNSDEKNPDNMIFDQIMMGYYAEMKDPKNADKTMQELKDIVFKNLAKDPIYYTKDGQFGIKDLGYVTEAPGLGEPKEAKGKYKSSGYGDLKEGILDRFKSKPLGDVEGAKKDIKKAMVVFLQKNTNLKNADTFTDKELLKAIEGFARHGELETSSNANKIANQIYKVAKPLFETEVEKFTSDFKDAVTNKKDSNFSPEQIKAKLADLRNKENERRIKSGEKLEEIALREAIRAMIAEELDIEDYKAKLRPLEEPYLNNKEDLATIQQAYISHIAGLNSIAQDLKEDEVEEAYQMPSVNTSGRGGEGGRRFIPKQLPFPQNIRRRFGDHIVFNPGNGTLYISAVLYNNLVKGYSDQPAIKKLIRDIPSTVKQVLNKPDNYGPTINLNDNLPAHLKKEFEKYHPLNAVVEKAKADKFNKAGDKQYWAEGDFLIPNLNIMEEDSMEPLRESVEKDLADINKEAEHEVLQNKLAKIDDLIDHKRSKLSKLDEDEDMKALTDKKKVKELEKDIKKLEVARKKVEKMMSKFKGKKKEVIDETEDLDVNDSYVEDATKRLDAGQDVDNIIDTYDNMALDQKDDLDDYLNDIAPDDQKSDYVS